MPRRRVDKVVEHRISLSDFERSKITEAMTTAQANIAIDGVTATFQAAGSALAGGGVLLAAGVFMLWKAPTLLVDVVNKVTETTNPIIDNIADFLLPSNPIELRREAQRLAAVRGEIASAEANYCNFSSGNYSETECSAVQQRKDVYFDELAALRQQVADASIGFAGFTAFGLVGKTLAEFVFMGLGDIDPNYGNSAGSPSIFTSDEEKIAYLQLTEEEKAAFWQNYEFSNDED